MPAKKKTPAKTKSAKVSSLQSKRPARSSSGLAKAGSKRKASPSPAPQTKKGVGVRKGANEREASGPSRQTSRGRSASRLKEEPKTRGGSKTSHVTRAAVEDVETKKAASRGRSKTPSTPKTKKATPQTSRQSKVEAQSAKQKKATPKQKAATPRQRSATSKSRATTSKQRAVTPKSKPGPQKNTPKAKNTPKQNAKVSKKTTPAKTVKKTPQKKQDSPKRGSSKSRKTEQESKVVTKSPVPERKSSPKKSPTKQETTPPRSASRSPRKAKGNEEADTKEDEEQEQTDETNEVSQAATTEQSSDAKINEEESKENVRDADNDTGEKEGVEEDKVEGVEEDESEAMETEQGINEDENVEQDQVVDEEADQPEVASSIEEVASSVEEVASSIEEVASFVEKDELVKEDQPDKASSFENNEPEATEEQEEEGQSSKGAEEKEVDPDSIEKHSDDSIEKDIEEDVTESQAESEQVESDDKECESVESEQVEADTPVEASNVSKTEPIVINEDSGDVADPEIISDGSEDNGDKVIEVNEDSDSAVIILDSKEVGSGDQAEQGNNVSKVLSAEENSSSFVEKDEESTVEVAEEAMENDAPSSSTEVGNGLDKQDDSEAKKRKIDEVDEVEDSGEFSKKAKVIVNENNLENGTVSKGEEDIDDEFVVIEMSDVPPIDSSEVQESIPKESVSNSVDKDINPIFNRDFVPNPAFSGPGDVLKQFSVISYNILADCHLFRNDYSFTENKFLVPEYRLEKIIEELKYLDGDIICMQEVDPAFFSEKLLPSLQSIGYEGFHKKRTEEYFNEGEATFYKTGRFTVVETQLHRQADLIEKVLSEGSVDQSVQDAIRKYVDMPDVLVVTKLKCNNTGAEVTVGNVHINWGEMKTPDIQCVQVASAIKETVSKAGGDSVPHIICGDFNSPPLSPGYLVARDGYPSGDETITKLQQIKGLQLPEGKVDSLVNCLWPAFQHTSSSLKSAYSEAQGKEPDITSYNQVMCECVDYIFYSSTSIDNVGVYGVPAKEKLMETGGTPNLYFPSDHVSVKALMSFK